MQREDTTHRLSMTAFSLYLRTGRRPDPARLEVKYNPWHDEENGQFTFEGQGRYVAASGGGSDRATPQGVPPSGQDRRQTRSADNGVHDRRRQRADHPDNYSTYIVRPGDSLARIATRRKGLKAGDLAWLNQQAADKPLQIGQRIKVPHQRYLDEGRAAKNRLVALAH